MFGSYPDIPLYVFIKFVDVIIHQPIGYSEALYFPVRQGINTYHPLGCANPELSGFVFLQACYGRILQSIDLLIK